MTNLDDLQAISFDLDGTLATAELDDAVWFDEIPARYAARRGLALADSRELVFADYRALRGHPRWTDMGFWFERLELGDWREAAWGLRHLARLYPDALPTLRALRGRYHLVLITQAERKFLDLKLAVEGLGGYFDAVYATPNDFGSLTKDAAIYGRVLAALGLAGGQALHVGDHPQQDVEAPRQAGWRALLLDRAGSRQGPDVIRDLRELVARLAA